MEIRRAEKSECTTVHQMAKTVGLFIYPLIIYLLIAKAGGLHVLIDNNRICGYYAYFKIPLIRTVFMLQVSLLPEYQKAGLGTELLNYATLQLTGLGYKRIYAHTLRSHVAIWLQKNRFELVGKLGFIHLLTKGLG